MPSIWRLVAILVLGAVGHATTAKGPDRARGNTFVPCTDAVQHPALAGTDCAVLDVPLDHAQPDRGSIAIFVRRFRADGEVRGQLWLVAGGPGESGALFYPHIATLQAAAPGFDLLIPDHRGTGFSTRLCPDEEAPQSDGGGALVAQEWDSCFAALNAEADRTRTFTISNAAQDLAMVMSRLDNGGRTYVSGVSYGTQLVLRMLALNIAPELDGIILDSLVPPEGDDMFDLSRRSAVTDSIGRAVLEACDEQAECRQYFPEGGHIALGRLLMHTDGMSPIGGKLKHQLAALLDFPETRAMIPFVIAGLQANDSAWLVFALARLEVLGAPLPQIAQSAPSIPLVSLISRSENNARAGLTSEAIEREAAEYLFTSPLPSLLLAGGFPTYQRDESFGALPAVLPPTIVLQGSLDPKTPYIGAMQHVTKLQARGEITLIRVEGAPHFILMTAPESFKKALQQFLGVHEISK